MEEITRPGRRFEGTKPQTVRLTEEESAAFRAIGGSDYLRRHVRGIIAGAPFSLRPRLLDETAKALFMEGAAEEGASLKIFPFGRIRAAVTITVTGLDAKEWGRQWARAARAAGTLPTKKP